jgi:hypothetical protein
MRLARLTECETVHLFRLKSLRNAVGSVGPATTCPVSSASCRNPNAAITPVNPHEVRPVRHGCRNRLRTKKAIRYVEDSERWRSIAARILLTRWQRAKRLQAANDCQISFTSQPIEFTTRLSSTSLRRLHTYTPVMQQAKLLLDQLA